MNDRVFVGFLNNYIDNLDNQSDKPKARFFKQYLEKYLSENMGAMLDTPDIFAVLDKEFLLDCINFYILEMNPAKGVAEDYRRTIFTLCEKVCASFAINNTFMESVSEQNDFFEKTTIMFQELKQSEPRGVMSIEEYELLNESFNSFVKSEDLTEKIRESVMKNNGRNYYGNLVNSIAFDLVQKFGLDNKTIANLKLSDLNIENKILSIKGFNLPIDNETMFKIKIYLKNRDLVVEKYNLDSDLLFIKRNGNLYLIGGQADNQRLFKKISAESQFDVTGLQNRAIVRMVSKGANINFITELTGTDVKTIARVCDYDSKAKEDFENLFKENRVSQSISIEKHTKGKIQCPYCGEYKDALSENWILIQIPREEKKHIACRECKGLDGKYRY